MNEYEVLDERVAVSVDYRDQSPIMIPRKMKRNGREIVFKRMGYHHQYQEGRTLFHIFTVTDEETFYELKFDTRKLIWTIGRTKNYEAV